MSYLLDTCIISKLRRIKTHPDVKLQEWVQKHQETAFYISVMTLGEIQAGIAKLLHPEQERQRMLLEDWLFGDLIPRFQGRILDITPSIAFTWGKMSGHGLFVGKPVPIADGLIAATAIHQGLIVVTENIKHFAPFITPLGIEIINPWAM